MHQGGWVAGDLDTCDTFCTRLAAELGAVVVCVDYRLAPDYQLPTQNDEADATWAWMNAHLDGLGIDPARLVVCGDSAGATMTATLCQRLRDAGEAQPAVQAMAYPLTDATVTDGSMRSCLRRSRCRSKAALREVGVEVIGRCEDSMSHSFLALGGLSPAAHAATGRLIGDIASLR